jgi:hypothetical protein
LNNGEREEKDVEEHDYLIGMNEMYEVDVKGRSTHARAS